MNVSQLMCRNVVTCGPLDSLEDAARKMWDHDIGCLPVVDSETRVIGILTDRDACMAAYTQGHSLKEIEVQSAMARHVFTRKATDRLQDVEAIMRAQKVRRIPIVDGEGCLVGMVSLNDLAREAAAERRRRTPDIADSEIVTTIAIIGEPRRTTKAAAAE